MQQPDLYASALKDALHSDEVTTILAGTTEEGTAAPAVETPEVVTSATVVDTPAEGDEDVAPNDEVAETEAATEEVEEQSDVPLSYFGMDLSEYTPEQRTEIIGRLSEQNQLISKLQRERVVEETTVEEPEAPVALSDEDIIAGLGLDEDDPFYEHDTKVALPLARKLLELQAQVEGVVSDRDIQETDRYWTGTLDALEKANGELPIDRLAVLEFAAENGLADPQDAYWRIAGPARAQLDKELTRRRAEVRDEAKRKVATPVRSAGAGSADDAPVEGEDVGTATRNAATDIAKRLGLIP